jgi:hypothetical protein
MRSAPGSLDGGEVLQGDGLAVDPPSLGRGLDHRVLAGHVVRGDGHVDSAAAGDDVEVGERRLHHHHVGALGDVGADLGQRLARVARVLLVALAVAAAGDRDVDRVAERAVQRGRVLGRVGEDRTSSCPRRRARRGWRRPGRPSSRSGATTSAPGLGLGDRGLA